MNQPSDDQGWEGQEEMGARLVAEALGDSPVLYIPPPDRVCVFPVVPDEKRPVDLHIVQWGGQDLPDMGVIVSVGYTVNADAMHMISEVEAAQASGSADQVRAIIRCMVYQVGEIVCLNQFSGMDVPGTNFVLVHAKDLLGKLQRFPVRLRTKQDRWEVVEAARKEGEAHAVAETIATPDRKVMVAKR